MIFIFGAAGFGAESFRGLGGLNSGSIFTVATGVSADGSVVVGYGSSEAFV